MHLNSKRDYYNIKKLYPVKTWYPYWKRLNENREKYYDAGTVATEEEAVKDDTHYYVAEEQKDQETEETTTVYRQYELRTDPLHPFYRLHFRQEEVDASIAEAKAALGES